VAFEVEVAFEVAVAVAFEVAVAVAFEVAVEVALILTCPAWDAAVCAGQKTDQK
jgi:hypothetical protein